MTEALDRYREAFSAPPGYLNFGSYGPPSRPVVDEVARLMAAAASGAPAAGLHAEDRRAVEAIARLSGFAESSILLSTSTSLGLFQTAFGMPPGDVLVSDEEFPSNLYAWWRAEEAGLLRVQAMDAVPTDAGALSSALSPVTAERIARSLTPDVVAVSVSAVDFRTGTRADLPAIREVIGDRLLVVDGIQGFGVVNAEWTLADVLIVGGQKWLRAGWGTGFVAFSDEALDRLRPVLGGWTGVEGASRYDGVPHELLPGAHRFSITNGSPFASGALATALELIESVGIGEIERAIGNGIEHLLAGLDRIGAAVLSPRDAASRAGIVVVGLPAGRGAAIHAELTAAGITATLHEIDRLRLSVHATTEPAALDAAVIALETALQRD